MPKIRGGGDLKKMKRLIRGHSLGGELQRKLEGAQNPPVKVFIVSPVVQRKSNAVEKEWEVWNSQKVWVRVAGPSQRQQVNRKGVLRTIQTMKRRDRH